MDHTNLPSKFYAFIENGSNVTRILPNFQLYRGLEHKVMKISLFKELRVPNIYEIHHCRKLALVYRRNRVQVLIPRHVEPIDVEAV